MWKTVRARLQCYWFKMENLKTSRTLVIYDKKLFKLDIEQYRVTRLYSTFGVLSLLHDFKHIKHTLEIFYIELDLFLVH